MARMPDGYVITVEADGEEWRLKESRELVMCKHCRNYDCDDQFCTVYGMMLSHTGGNWFCADGERRDSE